MISISVGGDHFLIGVTLLGRGLTSSLLAGGWSIVEVAQLAVFVMLVCSHYEGGVCLLIMILLWARRHSFLSLPR